jgi:hypothetical protein
MTGKSIENEGHSSEPWLIAGFSEKDAIVFKRRDKAVIPLTSLIP